MNDSSECREVWAALEGYPAVQVQSVVVSSLTYRWTCLIRVPWQRYGEAIATKAELAELVAKLAEYEEQQRAAAEAAKTKAADVVLADAVVVVEYSSGEKQLGLF